MASGRCCQALVLLSCAWGEVRRGPLHPPVVAVSGVGKQRRGQQHSSRMLLAAGNRRDGTQHACYNLFAGEETTTQPGRRLLQPAGSCCYRRQAQGESATAVVSAVVVPGAPRLRRRCLPLPLACCCINLSRAACYAAAATRALQRGTNAAGAVLDRRLIRGGSRSPSLLPTGTTTRSAGGWVSRARGTKNGTQPATRPLPNGWSVHRL